MEECKIITYENGAIKEIVDTRTLQNSKLTMISLAKEAASIRIFSKYPQFKQINAALGILSDDEASGIKSGIQLIRSELAELEEKINNCSTLDELDSL